MKRMLVVDDHPVLTQSTKALFLDLQLADEVDVCHTAAHTLQRLRSDRDWFRIWLDVEIPGARGLSLVREVCDLGFARQAAVISANRNPEWQLEVKRMGLLGYVPKATGFEAFQHAIRQIVQGREYFEDLPDQARPSRLTRRQIQILQLVAHGKMSKEIAALLDLKPGTVDNHIAAIVDALRAKGRSHAVAIGIEYGYVLPRSLLDAAPS